EGKIVVHQVPAAPVDREQLHHRRILRGVRHRPAAQVALAPVDLIEEPAGISELRDHLLFARRKTRFAVGHADRLPSRRSFRLVVYGTTARVARAGVALRNHRGGTRATRPRTRDCILSHRRNCQQPRTGNAQPQRSSHAITSHFFSATKVTSPSRPETGSGGTNPNTPPPPPPPGRAGAAGSSSIC